MSAGFVYFIRAGRTNALKIGFTVDPAQRLRELQCASPHQLHLVGYYPGTAVEEGAWHRRFASERIRGEWFDLSYDLRSAINELAVSNRDFTKFISLSLVVRNVA